MDGIRRVGARIGATPVSGRRARSCCPAELWRLRDRVPRARDELIRRHMGFARGIGLRFRNQRDTADDLIQVSYLGLVNAVDRYELERHVPFEAFAAPTIRGEVLRHLRDNSLPVHVTRGLQTLARRVERAHDELAASLMRAPSVEEIAAFMGEDRESVREALGVREAGTPISLDPIEGEEGAGDTWVGEIDGGFAKVEDGATLERAAGVLSGDERRAIGLRFAGDLSQTEIAAKLGVSQMTVSRLLRRGLEKLGCELGAEDDRRLN